MKVKEYIELLKELPQDIEVCEYNEDDRELVEAEKPFVTLAYTKMTPQGRAFRTTFYENRTYYDRFDNIPERLTEGYEKVSVVVV